eukprot:jgi/Tetstr1/458308/TSEL_000347.t1
MLLPPLQQVLYPLGEQVATAEDAQLSLRSGQQGGLIGLVSGQPDVTTSSGALPTTVEPLELAATKGSGVPAGTMIKSPDYEGEVTRIGVVETYMGEYDYQRLDDMIHGYVPGVAADPSCLCQPVARLISKKYEDNNAPELAVDAHPKIYKASSRALNDKNVVAIMHKIRVKPDPKPAAPAAKPKPKPMTYRKPTAPKAKSKSKSKVAPEPPKAKSKVAPEPPKAKAKSKVAPEPPKGGGQRKLPRGVRDYQKRLEKEAAAKEAEDGMAMDTLE